MTTIFYVAFAINLLVYFTSFINDLNNAIKNRHFHKAFEVGFNLGKSTEETLKAKETKSKKVLYIIGVFLAAAIILGAYFLVLWFPIKIAITYGINFGITAYFGFIILTSLPYLYKYGFQPNHDTLRMIKMSLVSIFRFQVMTILLYGWNFTLDGIVEETYESGILLSNTLTIIYPILIIATVMLSYHLYWVGLRLYSKHQNVTPSRLKLSTFFLTMVISSFSGLIYLSEQRFEFIDWSSGGAFDRVWNIFLLIIASILLPVLFSIVRNRTQQSFITQPSTENTHH